MTVVPLPSRQHPETGGDRAAAGLPAQPSGFRLRRPQTAENSGS